MSYLIIQINSSLIKLNKIKIKGISRKLLAKINNNLRLKVLIHKKIVKHNQIQIYSTKIKKLHH